MGDKKKKRSFGGHVRDAFSEIPPPELKRTLFRDFADIKEFYLEEEQKNRLEKMRPVSRGFYLCGWLLKSLFFKLTPIRRLLFFIAALAVFLQNSDINLGPIHFTFSFGEFGGIVLIFVLMLELKDKLLARDELAEGRAIQTRLLPDPSPKIPGWDTWLYSQPANDVGGDLIDCIRLNDHHHILVLGDVSGKGLPAALLMVKLQATIRALYTETIQLADLGSQINRIFHRDGITNNFATLVVLDIPGDSGKLRLLNAGHTPPLLIRGGRPRATRKGNPALGLLANTGYDVIEDVLQKGDVLMVYSDGINESRNEAGECFGNDRLFNLIMAMPGIPTADMGARILTAVRDFSGEVHPEDDQTLLVLKYLG
ncbi:MAG: PP2C family protein-serine/threonine phosphatase [Candidatus Aminicenantes bacterium]|nr:PP2C family protein-serine/threonine phosphatase [Candidatus Aminicenantes bacterium]